MPKKVEAVEDLLGAIEEKFYEYLKGKEEFAAYFGGRVKISFTTRKPKLNIFIAEQKRPGPRLGQKFKIDASKRVARRFAKLNPDAETGN